MITDEQKQLAELASLETDAERWATLNAALARQDMGAKDHMEAVLELETIRKRHNGPPGQLAELACVVLTRQTEAEEAAIERARAEGRY